MVRLSLSSGNTGAPREILGLSWDLAAHDSCPVTRISSQVPVYLEDTGALSQL